MKKQIIMIGALILAVLMIPVVLISFAFGLPAQYDRSFYGGMKIKYERLCTVGQNKIVVIGGSNVAFGLRSDIMEEELGMPVVNFGLYANLGTKVMLDIAEKHIKSGDIVMIMPEQNAQSLSLYVNGEAAWYACDGCFDMFPDVNRRNGGELAKGLLKFTSNKFAYWRSNNKPDPSGVYNARSFNELGDISYERPYNTMNGGYDAGTPISFKDDVIAADFIDYLNGFGEKAEKSGASVYYSFCPMNALALEEGSTDGVIKAYYDKLRQKLGFAVIGNPKAHLLDSGWFCDSNFHLNSAGAVYYTAMLAQELKAEINDFSPIKTVVPDMPKAPEEGGSTGSLSEDLEEAAKIFELIGVEITAEDGKVMFKGSWTVQGITEYGKTLTDITIPDTLCGVPVTGIAAECFKNNAVIENITFGKNIDNVGLDAFSGCKSLEAIYITALDPNVYNVGPNIIDGLDCYFYVPQAAYNDYIIDYFWSFINAKRPLRTF